MMLVFTSLRNLVSLEQSHHKYMGMYVDGLKDGLWSVTIAFFRIFDRHLQHESPPHSHLWMAPT